LSSLFVHAALRGMMDSFRDRYPPPWRVEELPGGYRVVSSNGFTLAWVYSLQGIARSADPLRLTHREARAMARAITTLARPKP
jgi:hypothetical protein